MSRTQYPGAALSGLHSSLEEDHEPEKNVRTPAAAAPPATGLDAVRRGRAAWLYGDHHTQTPNSTAASLAAGGRTPGRDAADARCRPCRIPSVYTGTRAG